jgi:hypothetical protein
MDKVQKHNSFNTGSDVSSQACSTFFVVRVTSAKFGLYADNAKIST